MHSLTAISSRRTTYTRHWVAVSDPAALYRSVRIWSVMLSTGPMLGTLIRTLWTTAMATDLTSQVLLPRSRITRTVSLAPPKA
jgi:hypothetical protein